MNTVEHLRKLFAYNDWANRRVVVALKSADSPDALKILAHILTTEQEYYARLFGKDSTDFDFWPKLTLDECGEIARETGHLYDFLLRRFDDEGLDIRSRYRSSVGTPFENTYREMLTHVLLHSATHRGNIVRLLRENNVEPPQTDYIIYLRETKYI